MSDRDTIAALQRNLAAAEVSRQWAIKCEEATELRAEVERLREALRDVAERQREACAEYLRHWTYDEHDLSRVRATPLVTEGGP